MIHVLRILLAIMVIGASSALAVSNNISGIATVIDGDTLEIAGERIRIWGIDAPENDQLCRGEDSLPYFCGAKATADLYQHLRARVVTCTRLGIDRYLRTIATCTVDGLDVGEWLVGRGLALDWPKYSSGNYHKTQVGAQQRNEGLWAGSFVNPWDFRACVRSGGAIAVCSDDYGAASTN
jgi:endonuclease YncB( thermonuclease family)